MPIIGYLNEMDKQLETHKTDSSRNRKSQQTYNRDWISNKKGYLKKKPVYKEKPRPRCFHCRFYYILRVELAPFLWRAFQNVEVEKASHGVSTVLCHRNQTKKITRKLQSLMNMHTDILNKIIGIQNPAAYKEGYLPLPTEEV